MRGVRARLLAVPRWWPALLVVVAAGAWLRVDGADWDAGAHLHPDERYLSLVAGAITLPDSAGEYLDPSSSPLNPYRTDPGRGFIYGTLPLFATKVVAVAAGRDGYDDLYLVGRYLSALLGVLTILVVFALARRMAQDAGPRRATRLALLAAALQATAVVAIQHSHFFTAETWLALWSALAVLLAGQVARTGRGGRRWLVLAGTGAVVGLAVASKLSGVLLAAPVALALVWHVRRPATARAAVTAAADVAVDALALGLAAYVSFRLASPYAFASGDWLDLRLNAGLRSALDAQAAAVAGDSMSPPNLQWLRSTPVLSPLANLLLWGLPVAGLLGLAGVAMAAARAVRALRGREPRPVAPELVLGAAFATVVLVAVIVRFVHPLRYLLPAVGVLCALAAPAVGAVLERRRAAGMALAAVALVAGSTWALAYTSVYRRPHPRVEAARWVEAVTPPGAVVVGEHWDDALPLDGSRYELRELPVFDADDAGKAGRLHEVLADADLYVLSSPRGWWTAGRLPDRFPVMTTFYRRLFAGRLGFERVRTFRSDPSLLGLTIRDTAAEEAQWVYDHPPVVVFRRTETLTRRAFRERLLGPLS